MTNFSPLLVWLTLPLGMRTPLPHAQEEADESVTREFCDRTFMTACRVEG